MWENILINWSIDSNIKCKLEIQDLLIKSVRQCAKANPLRGLQVVFHMLDPSLHWGWYQVLGLDLFRGHCDQFHNVDAKLELSLHNQCPLFQSGLLNEELSPHLSSSQLLRKRFPLQRKVFTCKPEIAYLFLCIPLLSAQPWSLKHSRPRTHLFPEPRQFHTCFLWSSHTWSESKADSHWSFRLAVQTRQHEHLW